MWIYMTSMDHHRHRYSVSVDMHTSPGIPLWVSLYVFVAHDWAETILYSPNSPNISYHDDDRLSLRTLRYQVYQIPMPQLAVQRSVAERIDHFPNQATHMQNVRKYAYEKSSRTTKNMMRSHSLGLIGRRSSRRSLLGRVILFVDLRRLTQVAFLWYWFALLNIKKKPETW